MQIICNKCYILIVFQFDLGGLYRTGISHDRGCCHDLTCDIWIPKKLFKEGTVTEIKHTQPLDYT